MAHPAFTDQPLVVVVNLDQADIQMAHGGLHDRSIQLTSGGMASIVLWREDTAINANSDPLDGSLFLKALRRRRR